MAKIRACRPKMTAAASGLDADTSRVITKTAVVTQAANLGPRTSTRSGWVAAVLLLDTGLLLDTPVARNGGDTPRKGPKLLRVLRYGRGYSAATATATTRDAAQINCA